jgi:hypothetical protein
VPSSRMDIVRTPVFQCDKSAGSKIVPATALPARICAPVRGQTCVSVP